MFAVVNVTRHVCHMTVMLAHMLFSYRMAGQAVNPFVRQKCIVRVHFKGL